VYSDEYIDKWANVFIANDLYHLYGIEFIAFIYNPERCLANALFKPDAVSDDMLPLLPEQRKVAATQKAIEQIRDACTNRGLAIEHRNDKFIQPMGSKLIKKWKTGGRKKAVSEI